MVLIISWRALGNPRSHGFYRFFAFEACLILFILNMPFWFEKPLSLHQILSWILLIICIFTVLLGFLRLLKYGKPKVREGSRETYSFEETSVLIRDGIYRYIRHPMYSSLIFFAWGAWLKHISLEATVTAIFASVASLLTAKIEERENLKTFGQAYRTYIDKTRMFIPFIF
jgi:protein-S-isoprenylcysteine O-methyltransferase Ste14